MAGINCLLLLIFISLNLFAENKSGNSIQRVVSVIDQQKSKVGKIEFTLDNKGRIGFDLENKRGGFFYPRNSNSQYLFGAGYFLFVVKNDSVIFTTSYNLNNSESNQSPGSINDGLAIDSSQKENYQVYNSYDYDESGLVKFGGEGPAWSIRKSKNSQSPLGDYINQIGLRTQDTSLKPIFISDEDLFATYKDTDTSAYFSSLKDKVAIGIQTEQTIYQWSKTEPKDFLLVRYKLINQSGVELNKCVFAPVFDSQITSKLKPHFGERNDKLLISKFDEKDVAILFSDTSKYEAGLNLNYMFIAPFDSPKILNGYANRFAGSKISMKAKQVLVEDNLQNVTTLREKLQKRISFAKDEIDQRLALVSDEFIWTKGDTLEFSYLLGFSPASNSFTDGKARDIETINMKLQNIYSFLNSKNITSVINSDIETNTLTTYNKVTLSQLDFDTLEIFDLLGNSIDKFVKNDKVSLQGKRVLLLQIMRNGRLSYAKYLD